MDYMSWLAEEYPPRFVENPSGRGIQPVKGEKK